ncbi:hypothetical protein CLU79DRAFT_843986 [Phycomyces nitens]|nr:hypothetical protein CLU79DRAFT_843986 [Phycomyces nitens]
MEKNHAKIDMWTSLGTYFSGFSSTNQTKFVEIMGKVPKSVYTKKEVETLIVSCTNLETQNSLLKEENTRLRENIGSLEAAIKNSSDQANVIARSQQKTIDDLKKSHVADEERINKYKIMENKHINLLNEFSSVKYEYTCMKPELAKHKDLQDRYKRLSEQMNEATGKLDALSGIQGRYNIASRQLAVTNNQLEQSKKNESELNEMVRKMSIEQPYLYNPKVLKDIVISISNQLNVERRNLATQQNSSRMTYTFFPQMETGIQEKIQHLEKQRVIATDNLNQIEKLEGKIKSIVGLVSAQGYTPSTKNDIKDKVTDLLNQLTLASNNLGKKEELQEEAITLREKLAFKETELFKAKNACKKHTKQYEADIKDNTLKADYFQQRLEQVESENTKKKLREILRKISEQCYTLKKFLNPKESEVSSFFFKHFGTSLPGLDTLCTKPDGGRGFSSGVIHLLVEKIIINNILRDICHIPTYFGLSLDAKYPKLSDYTPEKQTPEFSRQFRKNFDSVLKDQKVLVGLRKRREMVTNTLVKLLHELFPGMNPYTTRKKIMEIVEAAADLSLAIHTQDLSVHIIKLKEGKDQLRKDTKTQLGSTPGAKLIQIVVCPPFLGNEDQESEHVLLEGKVICFDIQQRPSRRRDENAGESDSEPIEERMYM